MVGEELEPIGARVRVGQSAGTLVLGAEVEFGDVDNLSVTARLLDEVDVGLGASAAEAELHGKENTPNLIDTSLATTIHKTRLV